MIKELFYNAVLCYLYFFKILRTQVFHEETKKKTNHIWKEEVSYKCHHGKEDLKLYHIKK